MKTALALLVLLGSGTGDGRESRILNFTMLKQFRQYVVDEHLKNLPESLRGMDGRVMTLSGFTFFRFSGEEIREVLLTQSPFARGGSGAPPGIFDSVRITFKSGASPVDMKNRKYLTVTGIFRIRHEVMDGRTVGLFRLAECVAGEMAPPPPAAGSAGTGEGTRLSYGLLEQAKPAGEGAAFKDVPATVREFDGRWVTLTGHVLIPYAAENVAEFDLAKNPWDGCCLGIRPTPFDIVKVRLRPGARLEDRFAPVLAVSGRFRIKLDQSAGYITGLYSLEDAVVGEIAENRERRGAWPKWTVLSPVALFVILLVWFRWRKSRTVRLFGIVLMILGSHLSISAQTQEEAISVGDIIIANNPKDPFLQGQALEKIERAGARAAPAIVEFVRKRGRNAMTLQMTQLLEAIRDPAVVRMLAELVEDGNFFWRPAAMAALAAQAESGHKAIFERGLTDPLWGVRQASIKGLEKLKADASAPEIKKLLADGIYDVRAQAAKTLYVFGDKSGLPVLVEALKDSTMWFDIDYGQIAREDAWNFLKKLSGDDFGFKPWESSDLRQPGLEKWEKWIEGQFSKWRERVPASARSAPDSARYLFGFELRSCQKGDFFFRIDSEGNLVLGCFNLVRSRLVPEDLKKFWSALELLRKVDPERSYGRPGCDFEKYYVRAEDGHYDTWAFFIEGRPGSLEEFIRTCRDLIRKHHGEGPAAEFGDRTPLFRSVK